MKMKDICLKTAAIACLIASVIACGGDDDGGGTNPGGDSTQQTIRLITQSISNGSVVDAATTTVLTLAFNQKISITTSADITLNGQRVTATTSTVSTTMVDIPLALEAGTSYTVKVAKGALVLSTDNSVSAPEITVVFSTREAVQPTSISSTPSTNCNDAAKQLYSTFAANYGKKIISGVMADVNWNTSLVTKVKTLTGRAPAMNCFDFIHIYVPSGNGWIDYADIAPVTSWARQGGIVQLMWHFNVPVSEGSSNVTARPSETTFKAANALTEGTWENRWYVQQTDTVAGILLKLQEAGIAATWRPYHEAAGNATATAYNGAAWFWWGDAGPETFKALWRDMYNRFQQKGIRNLLWIWTSQNYNGNSQSYKNDADWYPGDEYCDMIARDLYGYNATQNANEFQELQARYPSKMIALGECGYSGDGTGRTEQGAIEQCWEKGAHWSHFMVWYSKGNGSTDTMVSDSWWQSAMTGSHVITLGGL